MKFLLKLILLALAMISGFASNNAIDGQTQMKASKTKIPFPQVDDITFLRRVWLDATGTLPSNEILGAYLDSQGPWDRSQIIEEALASDAYVDRWANFLADMFNSRSFRFDAKNRNLQHAAFRDLVSRNLPWDEMARLILTFNDNIEVEGSFYGMWREAGENSEMRLDVVDDMAGFVTEKFLGVRTNCISCHDGAFHLEEINVGLSKMKRQQFWAMAAFFSSSGPYCETRNCVVNSAIQFQRLKWISADKPGSITPGGHWFIPGGTPAFNGGQYLAETETGDGMRPARNGGLVSPAYLFSGERPLEGESRREGLARILTADRQFARNMANRIWRHYIGTAFVEPVDGFDMARLNAEIAAENDTTVQPRDPEMMEMVTDIFIDTGYDLKELMRIIMGSRVYQLDYASLAEPEQGIGPYWGGAARVRRLEAEAIVDGISMITAVYPQYSVRGSLGAWSKVWQLPGTEEPAPVPTRDLLRVSNRLNVPADQVEAHQDRFRGLLEDLGRGDRQAKLGREKTFSHSASLGLLNGEWIQSDVLDQSPVVVYLANEMAQGKQTPEQVVTLLYVRTLMRLPGEDERARALAYLAEQPAREGIRDLLWSLFNHADFLYK